MRKAIKKPLTDRAMKGILIKLDKFGNSDIDKIEILEKSIENCWISVYELKNKKPPTNVDGKEKRVFNSNSISSSNKNYTQKIEGSKFI